MVAGVAGVAIVNVANPVGVVHSHEHEPVPILHLKISATTAKETPETNDHASANHVQVRA